MVLKSRLGITAVAFIYQTKISDYSASRTIVPICILIDKPIVHFIFFFISLLYFLKISLDFYWRAHMFSFPFFGPNPANTLHQLFSLCKLLLPDLFFTSLGFFYLSFFTHQTVGKTPFHTLSSQFFQENTVGNSDKGFTKVRVNNIRSFFLIHQAGYFAVDGDQVG